MPNRLPFFLCCLAAWGFPALALGQSDQVLVSGPEQNLTAADFKRIYRTLPADLKSAYLRDSKKLSDIITSTYVTKVAAHHAEQARLEQKPDVAAELWHRRINVLAGAAIEAEVASQAPIDIEAASEEYYLAHAEDYREPEKRVCSHILLDSQGDDAQELAAALRERLQNGELSFAEAVKQYSQEPEAAEREGRLPPFKKGDMLPSFERAAFALSQPGDLSPVVKTRFGYHIIRLEEIRPAYIKPFEQVEAVITKELKGDHRRLIREEYLLSIQKNPAIEVHQDRIDALVKQVQAEQKGNDMPTEGDPAAAAEN